MNSKDNLKKLLECFEQEYKNFYISESPLTNEKVSAYGRVLMHHKVNLNTDPNIITSGVNDCIIFNFFRIASSLFFTVSNFSFSEYYFIFF